MKDQHTKINGYRDLSQAEIDLMNKIKDKGKELEALVEEVRQHANSQYEAAKRIAATSSNVSELDRLADAQPPRWASIAETNLQQGLMALTRAVAQPTTF